MVTESALSLLPNNPLKKVLALPRFFLPVWPIPDARAVIPLVAISTLNLLIRKFSVIEAYLLVLVVQEFFDFLVYIFLILGHAAVDASVCQNFFQEELKVFPPAFQEFSRRFDFAYGAFFWQVREERLLVFCREVLVQLVKVAKPAVELFLVEEDFECVVGVKHPVGFRLRAEDLQTSDRIVFNLGRGSVVEITSFFLGPCRAI